MSCKGRITIQSLIILLLATQMYPNASMMYLVQSFFMFSRYILLPTQAEAQWSMRTWQTQTGIPGIVCAIDGTHIAIPRPCCNGETFYNRKNFYSLNIQSELNWPHH